MLIMLTIVGMFKKHWSVFAVSTNPNLPDTASQTGLLYVQDLYKFLGAGTHEKITKASEEIWTAYSQRIISPDMTIEDLIVELGLEEELLKEGVEKLLGTFF